MLLGVEVGIPVAGREEVLRVPSWVSLHTTWLWLHSPEPLGGGQTGSESPGPPCTHLSPVDQHPFAIISWLIKLEKWV